MLAIGGCSELLPYSNLVIGNEEEFRALAESLAMTAVSDVSAVARFIAGCDFTTPPNQKKKSKMLDLLRNGGWN